MSVVNQIKRDKANQEAAKAMENPTEKLLNEIEVVEPVEVKKKTQKPSATYTLTQMGNIISKLKELELINDDDKTTMEKIKESAIKEWMSKQFK